MVNKVILAGRLTADPEVRVSPKGTHVARLRIATNTYLGKDEETGLRKEVAEFHTVVCFGATAEYAGNHLRKGRVVLVDGRLHHDSYEDQAGVKKYVTEVIVERIQALERDRERTEVEAA